MKAERPFPGVSVSNKAERSLRAGHPWLYAEEILSVSGELSPGGITDVFSLKGAWLGAGIYSPASKIAVRVLSDNANERFTDAFFERRVRYALEYRRRRGLDLKDDVIRFCEQVARDLGYDGLSFLTGDIQSYVSGEPIDMVVTLHACDVATDAAIVQAIGWDCRILLTVPCCQHELFPKIRNDRMKVMLKHGIIKERFSALLTDSIRGQLLEACGYDVNIMEFISLEHTPKNTSSRRCAMVVRTGRSTRNTWPSPRTGRSAPTSRKNWCASDGFRNDRTDFYMEAHWDCFQGAFYCNKNPPAIFLAGGFCTFSEFYLSS